MSDAFWYQQYQAKAKSANPFVNSGRTDAFDLVEYLHSLHLIMERLFLKRNDIVLDVGCANGLTEIVLSSVAQKVCAVEIVPELMQLAKRQNAPYPNVEIQGASADAIPYPDGTFTKLLCFNVIQLITDRAVLDKAFGEFARVLQPGGQALVADIPDLAHRDRIVLPYLEGVKSSATLAPDLKKEIITRNERCIWYAKDDLKKLAESKGLRAEILALPKTQPHHDHRYDLFLTKPGKT